MGAELVGGDATVSRQLSHQIENFTHRSPFQTRTRPLKVLRECRLTILKNIKVGVEIRDESYLYLCSYF